MEQIFFAMVMLFATPDGHQTGVQFFPSAEACEAAKPQTTAMLVEKFGATEVGLSCSAPIHVVKLVKS